MKRYLLIGFTMIFTAAGVWYLGIYRPNLPIKVETEQVSSQILTQSISAEGVLSAKTAEMIYSPGNGKITALEVENYQTIGKDTLLARVEHQTGIETVSTELTSPIDGTVVFNNPTQFTNLHTEMPVTNYQLLFRIVDLNDLEFIVGLPEADLNLAEINQTATITLDAWPNDKINAHVSEIKPMTNQNQLGEKTIPVVLSLENQSEIPEPKTLGLSGNVTIISSQKSGLTVPLSSLVSENGDDIIYVIRNEEARKLYVTVGNIYDNNIEITDGIRENDVLITNKLDEISDGQKVTPE